MKKHLTPLVLIAILLVALSACTKPASTPPPPTTTPDLEGIMAQATTTALAQSGGAPEDTTAGEEEAISAPEEAEPTNTAVPAPTSMPTMAPVSEYGVPNNYTLHKGEFPYCLARRFNINQDTLLAHNGLSKNTQLPAGYTLQIPTGAGPFYGNRALRSHPTSYTVAAGDTFYSVACLFGNVDPRAIAEANGMSVSDNLSTGMVIQIP